jgi:DNA-binding CsgD family transcriptional regulator
MSPVSASSSGSVSPFQGGQDGRPRLSVRVLSEFLAELADDGSDVIVLAFVPSDQRPSGPQGSRRPESKHRTYRPVGLSTPKERQPADSGWAHLTERERAVAVLAGQALTNQQIAHRLRISPHTVNFHLRQIFRKLAIDSRVSLARIVPARPSVVDAAARGSQPTDSGRPEPPGSGVSR